MTFLLILLFAGLTVDDINADADHYIEIHSGKQYIVQAIMNDPLYEISIQSGPMRYIETLARRADTLFIDKRILKLGIIRVSMKYSPPRPRIVLPVEHNDTLLYRGTERFLGMKNEINSYLITDFVDPDYRISAITVRKSRADTSIIRIDSTGTISYISVTLPFPMLYRLLGFKQRKLEFVPYEQ